jgi:hypothetical protein
VSSGRGRAARARCSLAGWHSTAVQGRARRCHVHQQAHDVVVQPPGRHDLKRLIGQGVGLGPVVACDRQQAALGQRGRDGGQGAGEPTHLDGVGQGRVGLVGLAVQQLSHCLDDHGGRPPWACRAQPGKGSLGIGPDAPDPVEAQQPAQHRQVPFHGAAIRRRLCSCVGVGRCRLVLGGVGPAFGGHRPDHQCLDQGSQHGDRRVALDQRPLFEPPQPPLDGLDPPAGPGPEHQPGHQPGHPVGVPGGLGMIDRQHLQPVGLTSAGRPGV